MMFSLTRNFVLVFLALFVCGNVSLVQGTILFHDNFESDGTDPGQDPVIGAGDIGGNWNIYEQVAGKDDGVQVENDPLIANAPITGNNFLHVTRVDRDTRKGYAEPTGWDIAPTMEPGAIVTYSASLYMPSAGGNSTTYVMGEATNWDEIAGGLGVFGDGHATEVHNWPGPVETLTAVLDQWQEVSIVVDMDNQVYDLTVGSSTVTDLPFKHPVARIGFMYIASGADGSHFYLDNVKLTVVPEPSAVAMLGFSLASLLVFAWRRRR